MQERKYAKKGEENLDKSKWTGAEYKLEDGDSVVSKFAKVRTFDGAMIKDGKAVPVKKHSLQVTDSVKGDIYIKITEGQKKQLDKTPDLTGKTITAVGYESKQGYGKLVGVRVK